MTTKKSDISIQQQQQEEQRRRKRKGRSIIKILFNLLWLLSLLSFPVTVILVTFIESYNNNNNVDGRGGMFHQTLALYTNSEGKNYQNSTQQQQQDQEQKKRRRHQQQQQRKQRQKRNKNGNGNDNDNQKQRKDKRNKIPVDKRNIKFKGKERLIDILSSDPKIAKQFLSDENYLPWDTIPTDDHIKSLYYNYDNNNNSTTTTTTTTTSDANGILPPKPVIYGLDTCNEYRNVIVPNKCNRILGPAGLYNTGTNLLAQLLDKNCYFPECEGKQKTTKQQIQFQVPWGKHTPPEFRLSHTIQDGQYLRIRNRKADVLPIVLIREPYEWMRSTCSNNYVLRWPHRHRCPNLWSNKNNTYIQVMNQYYHGSIKRYHTSLAHFYNDWYNQYIDYVNNTDPENILSIPKFPRLIVRHKDLLFYPKETITSICKCAGGTLKHEQKHKDDQNFQYVYEAAKPNRPGLKPYDGLVGNFIKYGNEKFNCNKHLNHDDIILSRKILNKTILKIFHYDIDTLTC